MHIAVVRIHFRLPNLHRYGLSLCLCRVYDRNAILNEIAIAILNAIWIWTGTDDRDRDHERDDEFFCHANENANENVIASDCVF